MKGMAQEQKNQTCLQDFGKTEQNNRGTNTSIMRPRLENFDLQQLKYDKQSCGTSELADECCRSFLEEKVDLFHL